MSNQPLLKTLKIVGIVVGCIILFALIVVGISNLSSNQEKNTSTTNIENERDKQLANNTENESDSTDSTYTPTFMYFVTKNDKNYILSGVRC